MAEAGVPNSSSETTVDLLLRYSPFFRSKPIPDKIKEEERRFLNEWIKDLEEDEEKEMPPFRIVMFPDLVEKAWGWERLLPLCEAVEWSDYSKYLQAYHKNNAPDDDAGTVAGTGSTLVAIAKRCLEKENQLASKWTILPESHVDAMLLRKNIILSSLVKECAHSVILNNGAKSSAVFCTAAFVCIENETDLILELLRRGAHPNDDLIQESMEIRLCALSLMGHSDIAAGAMLGIAKEASMMREWMNTNQELLDLSCGSLPDHIEEGLKIRFRTLQFMTSLLIMPHTRDAAVSTDNRRDDSSDKWNDQDQVKVVDADNSKKRKRIEDTKKEIIEGGRSSWVVDEHAHSSAVWRHLNCEHSCHDVVSHHVEALDLASMVHAPRRGDTSDWKMTALSMLSANLQELNLLLALRDFVMKCTQLADVLAGGAGNFRKRTNFCLKMEECLVSEWRIQLSSPNCTLPIHTIIESSLIRERAHSSLYATGNVFSGVSGIAFECIALEADLMCELLRHGAKPNDDILEQSSVIRLCALSLLNLRGGQSVFVAVVMMGIAQQARMIRDWVKKEKKHINFSSSMPRELEESCLARSRSLDVVIKILQESFSLSEMAKM